MHDFITLDIRAPKGSNVKLVGRLMAILLTDYDDTGIAICITIVEHASEMVLATANGLPDDEAYERVKNSLFEFFGQKYRVHLSESRQGKEFEALVSRASLH